jgi:hypothetical protein
LVVSLRLFNTLSAFTNKVQNTHIKYTLKISVLSILDSKANGTGNFIFTKGKYNASNSLVGCGRTYFHLRRKCGYVLQQCSFRTLVNLGFSDTENFTDDSVLLLMKHLPFKRLWKEHMT